MSKELNKFVFDVYINWFAEKTEKKLDKSVIDEMYSSFIKDRSLLVQKMINNCVADAYSAAYKTVQENSEFWKSLVLEATKKEWCTTPDMAVEYANSIIDTFNGFLNEK